MTIIKLPNSNQVPAVDDVNAALLKAGGDNVDSTVHSLIKEIW